MPCFFYVTNSVYMEQKQEKGKSTDTVSYTHLDVYKRQDTNRPYSPSWLSMDSIVHPCTSVAMYRIDFKHTLSYCVDSFEMYMYSGFLKLWIYYTYILNYT